MEVSLSEQQAWQLKIFNRTLKKKEKLAIIRRLLPELSNCRCLDLGCARGTIGYFLEKEGGRWFHEDIDWVNVRATADLVGSRTAVIPPTAIPHPDNTFDVIVSLDILEHLHDDRLFAQEMSRVLKPGGRLILSTPVTGPFYLVNHLKNLTGLTPDQYGHVVEGYTLSHLTALLTGTGLIVEQSTTYSRFFTEFVEFLLNLVFVKFLRKDRKQKRDGNISPGTADEVKALRKQLAAYSFLYPMIWIFTRLDELWRLARIPGYATLLVCRKP